MRIEHHMPIRATESAAVADLDESRIAVGRVAQITCAECREALDVSNLPSFSEIKCPKCGMVQIIPAKFGGFWLIGQLGGGGMGVVYHAIDKDLGRHVALKVMKKEMSADHEFIQAFKHEAQAAAALNHVNVVQVYSFGEVSGQFYIAMELVGGGRLDEMIVDGASLEETQALEIHMQVLAGLRAASEVGLVHGDIKPANILFGQNGEAKVLDFGLASFIGQQKTGGAIWGTPYYIAPEKARGKPVDFRSDIYSLGATLFHVLTGQPPFDGATTTDVVMARLNQPAPNLLDINADLHPETAAMVARMLEADPTMRHPSYPALQIDMEAALAASRKPLKKTAGFKPPNLDAIRLRPAKLNRKILVRAGIGLAAAAAAAAMAWGIYAYRCRQVRIAAETAERLQIAKATDEGEATFGRINALAGVVTQLGAGILPVAERINKIAAANSNLNTAAARAALEIDRALDILNETEDIQALADIEHQRLQAAANYDAAQASFRQLDDYFNTLIKGHNLIQEHKVAAEKLISEASAILAQSAAAARRARETAALQAARQKEAEAARRLAEQQAEEAARLRPKMIQLELDMIDRARGANAPLIAQREFGKAAQALAKIKDNLTQPETQAYFKSVLDSCEAMARLKTFVVGAIKQAPYPSGWTSGGNPRDIIRADDANGLTVTLGAAGSVNIAWERVSAAQLIKIANYYLSKSGLAEAERADIVLAMALLCYESGNFKTAATYAAAAIQINPALKSETQRLMPGFAEE